MVRLSVLDRQGKRAYTFLLDNEDSVKFNRRSSYYGGMYNFSSQLESQALLSQVWHILNTMMAGLANI